MVICRHCKAETQNHRQGRRACRPCEFTRHRPELEVQRERSKKHYYRTRSELRNKKAREYRLKRKMIGRPIKRSPENIILRSNGKMSWAKRLTVSTLKGMGCVYCGKDSFFGVDHIEPLCLGGSNEYTNLAPCCKSCNSSKQGKPLQIWLETRRISILL